MDVGGLLGNEAIRARLDAAAAQDRFSHSYLICGPDGSGKHTLAKILAAAMQCTGAGRKPCGRCEGCRKVFEGVHPDVITVNDPAHKTIAVDVIRQMRADVFLRPNEGKRKIYLIEQYAIARFFVLCRMVLALRKGRQNNVCKLGARGRTI